MGTPQEREYLLTHFRKIVGEIAEDAVAIGGEPVRFRVAAALQGIAAWIED